MSGNRNDFKRKSFKVHCMKIDTFSLELVHSYLDQLKGRYYNR